MSHGGKREGAGRKKGTPNKASIQRQAKIASEGITPLDYLLAILRDDNEDKRRRDWAAKEAAPYVHPKLAATEMEHNVSDAARHRIASRLAPEKLITAAALYTRYQCLDTCKALRCAIRFLLRDRVVSPHAFGHPAFGRALFVVHDLMLARLTLLKGIERGQGCFGVSRDD
jgi:hypothetical protein